MKTVVIAACVAAVLGVAWANAATAQQPGAAVGAKSAKPPALPIRYTGRDGTYAMPVPAVGPGVDVSDTMINERAGWVQFRSTDGTALYVVSTRLVDGPRDARELDAVRRRYADFARQLPERFVEWSGKGRFGPSYGFTLINAEGVVGYPVKVGYRGMPEVQSAAVHRFFVQNGVLYEVAALVQKTGSASALNAAQLEKRALAQVDAAIGSIDLVHPAASRPATTKPPEKK